MGGTGEGRRGREREGERKGEEQHSLGTGLGATKLTPHRWKGFSQTCHFLNPRHQNPQMPVGNRGVSGSQGSAWEATRFLGCGITQWAQRDRRRTARPSPLASSHHQHLVDKAGGGLTAPEGVGPRREPPALAWAQQRTGPHPDLPWTPKLCW